MMERSSHHPRPAKGTATERVWAIADDISRKQGARARRRQVIEKYVAEGGNPNTASTQYYYWSQKYAPSDAEQDAPDRGRQNFIQVRVEPNGRVLIPAVLREQMDLGEDGKAAARVVDGELRLISPRMALRKLRERARQLVPDGGSVVAEFIAEKREEAERE